MKGHEEVEKKVAAGSMARPLEGIDSDSSSQMEERSKMMKYLNTHTTSRNKMCSK